MCHSDCIKVYCIQKLFLPDILHISSVTALSWLEGLSPKVKSILYGESYMYSEYMYSLQYVKFYVCSIHIMQINWA